MKLAGFDIDALKRMPGANLVVFLEVVARFGGTVRAVK